MVLPLWVASCGLGPPERVDFDPGPLLPPRFEVVLEEFTPSMMGAGPEFHNGHWLISARTAASGEDAIEAVTDALIEAGLDVRPPGSAPEGWQVQLEGQDAWVYMREYVPGMTEVDTFAPDRELATAARAHSGEGPLLYLHAVGA